MLLFCELAVLTHS